MSDNTLVEGFADSVNIDGEEEVFYYLVGSIVFNCFVCRLLERVHQALLSTHMAVILKKAMLLITPKRKIKMH